MSIKITIIHVFFHKQPPVIYIKEPPYFRKGVLIYSSIQGYFLKIISQRLQPAPYIPCVYNDVHFELELSGQLTDAGCPEKGWCAPPHQQKDQSVIYYP